MSKGSPIVKLRVKPEILARIQSEIERVNERRTAEPYCLSSFILKAVLDKLDHLARSRKTGKKSREIPFAPNRPPLHYEP